MIEDGDRFCTLDEVKAKLVSGKDYLIHSVNRLSPITVFAPHGGFIEPGTSAIAHAVAGNEYNLFDFQALIPDQEQAFNTMHVTSTFFRDPQLDELLTGCVQAAISIHGMVGYKHEGIWLGGLNGDLKAFVHTEFVKRGFEVDIDAPFFRGESPKNVVNLPRRQGVQIELADTLRRELFVDQYFCGETGNIVTPTARFDQLVAAIREAISAYLRNTKF